MRSFWRGEQQPLSSHDAWATRLDPKNRRKGTSAPTLAEVWAGPLELFGALRHQDALQGLRVTEIVVEARSAVDEFSGPRNHDLVVRAQLPNADGVVVCIEAKAGESFDATVGEQVKTAAAAKAKSEDSNAQARLDGLLERFVPHPPEAQRVRQVRYQLLTALAGTISEAQAHGARHAVLMVHEFVTNERNRLDVIEEHDRDLWNFCTTVFGLEPPDRTECPWCIAVGTAAEAPDVELYLARAVTDLRTATLERRATED
jgi:hypothetical protein